MHPYITHLMPLRALFLDMLQVLSGQAAGRPAVVLLPDAVGAWPGEERWHTLARRGVAAHRHAAGTGT